MVQGTARWIYVVSTWGGPSGYALSLESERGRAAWLRCDGWNVPQNSQGEPLFPFIAKGKSAGDGSYFDTSSIGRKITWAWPAKPASPISDEDLQEVLRGL
jgi:hypothetical protein